ncbi:DUF1286 domain-containing protein [Conexivisphaera calida]|uniref:DUF1286 domain-containing protein n=1 Tax=Conexivisphaera calida TaxID=1874277 RepID=A0A4P2VCZ2_9ARCH|nr:DUF1286 domain-containing protein [Conexivisphaera calida]BBE42459.1 hypothetical protein NAS2_1070 [Conexivisphaera calida]
MKLATHYAFTIGLVALAARTFLPVAGAIAAAAWLGLLVNWIIDRAGHEVRGGIPRRTAGTHSLPGAVGVGVAVGVLPVALMALVDPTALAAAGIQLSGVPLIALIMAALGALAGLSHLLLDALTEGGIFYHGRRWALAHWRYNDAGANALFALLGILMLGGAALGL